MANVFGILTLIALLSAAYVAMQNKDAYAAEITERKDQQRALGISQDRLKTAQNTLASTEENRKGVEEETVGLRATETEQEAANKTISEEIASKRAKVEANETKLDELRERTAAAGNLDELAANMSAARAELEELELLSTAATANLANLTSENNRTEQIIANFRNESELISRGESLPKLDTSISAIYSTWGFVTLAGGNNAGVVNNSTLHVVRGGEVVAKLLVTAVESNTASASIIPDSLGEDVTLMVGDRVVPGSRAAN